VQRNVGDYEQMDLDRYDRSLGMMRRREATQYVRLLEQHAVTPRRWLDVGCGVGSVLREAQRAGYAVLGAEPDPIARALAAEALDGTVVEHFGNETVANGSQGVISMLDVLEHFQPDGVAEITELVHTKLAEGGYWLLKVPSADGLFYSIATTLAFVAPWLAGDVVRRLWLVNMLGPHRVYFREASLRRLVERRGFDVVSIVYTETIPLGSVFDRLRLENTIPWWKALAIVPAIAVVNAIERIRRRTDSLVVLARKRPL
jgi:SAM-dependent methyltransferase